MVMGVLFTMLGMYLVFNEDNLSKVKNMNEMMKMAYDGRYGMLLLMGLFAVYCGFIYNEFLCLGLDLFRYVERENLNNHHSLNKSSHSPNNRTHRFHVRDKLYNGSILHEKQTYELLA